MTGGTGGTSTMTGGTGGTGTYEPCSNRACGAQCSVCPPDDMTCAADAVITYCDATGQCTPSFPMCQPTACETTMDCGVIDAPCQLCVDGTTACPTIECAMGQCIMSYPTCPGQTCMGAEECPVIDAPCTMCADGTTVCPWSDCVNGVCTTGIESCGKTNPCEGKVCGDSCTPCTGGNCAAAAPIVAASYCNENLECQFNVPMCSSDKCSDDSECLAPEICMACPDTGECAQMKCLSGACQWQCTTKDPCGGTCGMEQVCVHQLGGPGPAHDTCAGIAPPCDAADICGCIAGQGMCHTDATTGRCFCENGLE
jgi:hypothetical protein